MKTLVRMSLFLSLLVFTTGRANSQAVTVSADSSKVVATGKATAETAVAKKSGEEIGQKQNKDTGNSASKDMKKIRSNRPDMSKTRGARPPIIIRPGGAGIPKGVGRPTGVGNKGGR